MDLTIYQVNSFTGAGLAGNPAAVVPLGAWIGEAQMQAIAAWAGLSETAFLVPGAGAGRYQLRWFTPLTEVDLCGHATLAAGYVLFGQPDAAADTLEFETRSGLLTVRRSGHLLEMDFPAEAPVPCAAPAALEQGLGARPAAVLAAADYLAVFDQEEDIRSLTPDFAALARLDRRGVCATAPGTGGCDFVSRFFAPKLGVDEDPVTGSAHCMLAPYWGERLGRDELHAVQLSPRGGELWCRVDGGRVILRGRAVLAGSDALTVPGSAGAPPGRNGQVHRGG